MTTPQTLSDRFTADRFTAFLSRTRLYLAGLLWAGAAVMLSSCSSQEISIHKGETLELSLEQFFEGRTSAYGVFEDRFGQLRRQFRVDIEGRTEGGKLILDEKFLYDDGEQARRIWTISREDSTEDGLTFYTGTADDITGTATGMAAGNVLSWSYDITLDMGGTELEVRFDDAIYQMTDELAINRAEISKWGVQIGTVTIIFLRGDLARTAGVPDLTVW